ncbi:hypothetical protein L5515_002032 [Caenorhabditis briggsae]|uniref:Uncharacterized protein n=1 Tax=Caenorhabditis briggsae TaxID=6238 RepID=A0AAE9J514_CAEBR|nr:hypothetical protein L5515_002032 [Caenorhabditis briggsae]
MILFFSPPFPMFLFHLVEDTLGTLEVGSEWISIDHTQLGPENDWKRKKRIFEDYYAGTDYEQSKLWKMAVVEAGGRGRMSQNGKYMLSTEDKNCKEI